MSLNEVSMDFKVENCKCATYLSWFEFALYLEAMTPLGVRFRLTKINEFFPEFFVHFNTVNLVLSKREK